MKKVLVIGSGGAGKSTFSRELGEITKIPVVHLDAHYWQPNWQKMPEDEWKAKVEDLLSTDSWIMDGNFGGTREARMRAADTIIFLDLPRLTCMYRVLKRVAKYYGKTRPDMAEGCTERLDLEFLMWVWNYPNRGRLRFQNDVATLPEEKVIVLKSALEVRNFLDEQRHAGN